MRNTIRVFGLAMLFVAVGCGDAEYEEALAKQAATAQKSVDTGESKWLEQPQESLKGDVVTYEVEDQIATKAKFIALYNQLEVTRAPVKQRTGEIIRECPAAEEGPDKGKPAPKDCKIEVPTFDTYYMATHKEGGVSYSYRAQRARYPDRNILRHFLKKK
ncbi:MAG: hypothetical protein JRF63_15755 [Deltaproteobacteria bacterium]|nr:hypothetical protein [Deltaproteobacteria bacterium]